MDDLARHLEELLSHPYEWARALIVALTLALAHRVLLLLARLRAPLRRRLARRHTTTVGASLVMPYRIRRPVGALLAMPYKILEPVVASGTSTARATALGSEAIADGGMASYGVVH